MEKLNAIRQSIRAMISPPYVALSSKAGAREYDRLLKTLAPVERTVWSIVREGDPTRLAEYLLLFKATQAEVRRLASNIRRSTQHSLALWPDIPLSWNIRNRGAEKRWVTELPLDVQQEVLDEWSDDENQGGIIAALGWYHASHMGQFFVRTGVDARVLSAAFEKHMEYPVKGSPLLPPIPIFPVMKSVAEAGIWIGRYTHPEQEWAFVSGGAGAGNELIQMFDGIETATLLKHDGAKWSLVSGNIE